MIPEAAIGGGEWLGLAVALFLVFAAGKTWEEREKARGSRSRLAADRVKGSCANA